MFRIIVFLLSFLMLSNVTTSASAHRGRTDGNGGHVDSSTGDYHYHHGYEAHAHYDMDGDGDIDCPFDFDDQTNHESGTSSVSYSDGYNDGKKDGYTDGYEDGYNQGKIVGHDEGYNEGVAKGEEDTWKTAKEEISKTRKTTFWVTLVSVTVLYIIYALYTSKRQKKEVDVYESRLQDQYAKRARELEESHANEIKKLNKLHSSEIKELRSKHAVALSHAEYLQKKSEERAADWERKYEHEKQNAALLKASMHKNASPFELPDDITLEPFFTPIKGEYSKNYPYGEYTIFLTQSGRKYHCRHDCVSNLRTSHFFDLPYGMQPCERCVPKDMYPQPLPEWTKQISKK